MAITKIVDHPNFCENGGIDIDILNPIDWKPQFSVQHIVDLIIEKLRNPDAYLGK